MMNDIVIGRGNVKKNINNTSNLSLIIFFQILWAKDYVKCCVYGLFHLIFPATLWGTIVISIL